MTGKPAAVFTLYNDPENVSSTENNLPAVPSIVKTFEPDEMIPTEPVIVDEPVILAPPWSTIKPFFTLN